MFKIGLLADCNIVGAEEIINYEYNGLEFDTIEEAQEYINNLSDNESLEIYNIAVEHFSVDGSLVILDEDGNEIE